MAHEIDDGPALAGIAIIAMVGRFPGAPDLDAYWRVIRDGAQTITYFTDEQLAAAGVDPQALANPAYVKARGVLEGVEEFDPAFFGFSPRDAVVMDPQQRLFFECTWEALEKAGYDPRAYGGPIGLYGGASPSSYHGHLWAHYDLLGNPDVLSLAIGNELQYLTTRVSYKLDLRGPSYPVQTACSTSIVAIHLAVQGLLSGECDMAVAGAVSVRVPQASGYWYQEDSILSPDGRCRSFDANANGTVFGNGIGMVVLKRLEDALADGDTIHAVIAGSAINNDGSRKASFTAPAVGGQGKVIADALAAAAVQPADIQYIEAHGTATSLGDSIEVQGLVKAFGKGARRRSCAIGSVKANVGHLDAAAGVAGLIKTVLAMERRQLPPSAAFERPNPDLQLDQTPFYVNTTLTDWPAPGGAPRRAGVSSFGFGGTNGHLVIEEAPAREDTDPAGSHELLVLSAETPGGLERATTNLAAHLAAHPDSNIADVAYTLQVGRRAFRHRRALVAADRAAAIRALEDRDASGAQTGQSDGKERPVVFLFPGQGSQHVGMAGDLYREEPAFREVVDECAAVLAPDIGCDIRTIVYPDGGATDAAAERLTDTRYAQPALFVVEYALARLWMSWGVVPEACIGHSVGEFVAACLAGVLSLEDALRLVALRGRLMAAMPAGAMLAVPLPEPDVKRYLDEGLWTAAVNAPSLTVVAGSPAALDALQARLDGDGIECQRVRTSHAFHSGLMEAAVEPFVEAVAGVSRSAPRIPYISNVTGTWIRESDVLDAGYWGRQIREPVRFADGVTTLLASEDRLYLEVGPGTVLSTLVRRQAAGRARQSVIASLRRAQDGTNDVATLLGALGQAWLAGARVEWAALHEGKVRRRVPLPTYPFERQRYWVSRAPGAAARPAPAPKADDRRPFAEWFYAPVWTRVPVVRPAAAPDVPRSRWLVFLDDDRAGQPIVDRIARDGHEPVVVTPGRGFARIDAARYEIDPGARADYDALIREVAADGGFPRTALHLWGLGHDPAADADPVSYEAEHARVFRSVLLLAQALGESDVSTPVELNVVTSGAHDVSGDERLSPGKATVLGLLLVVPQEHPTIACRNIDLAGGRVAEALAHDGTVEALLREASGGGHEPVIAFRNGHRWVREFRPLRLPETGAAPRLRERGVYLLTGGLGDIALNFAEYLARRVRARLVLTGRSELPPESRWDEYLKTDQGLTGLRIARVRRLQALGAEVLTVKADAGDAAAMARAFEAAETRFGRVDGVIHAAGLVDGDAFQPILQTDDEVCRRQFLPKVDGLCVLDRLLASRTPDFCVLVSSLSALLGGIRYASYASANVFMDAFAHRRNRTSPTRWHSINWDGFVRAEDEARLAPGTRPAGFVMVGSEAVEALHRILNHEIGTQVVVSTGDLASRVDRWVRLGAVEDAGAAAHDAPAAARHPRPTLQTDYVAPRTDVERSIAGIWQELLGLEKVGVNDSFFELGGDSFLGIQAIARIKKQLDVKVSAVTLYEGPTVAALAQVIAAQGQAHAPVGLDHSRLRGERRREKKLRALASQQVET